MLSVHSTLFILRQRLSAADAPFQKYTTRLARLVVAILVLGVTNSVWGQSPTEEIWFGTLDVKIAQLRLEFRIAQDDQGGWTGKMISLDQGNAEIPAAVVERSSGQLRMEFPRVSGTYEGALNQDATRATGTWTQFGNAHSLDLRRVDAAPQRHHVESWQGTLQAAGRDFEFQIRVFAEDQGDRSAVLDSFSESIVGLPLELQVTEEQFDFTVVVNRARFKGKKSDGGQRISGEWRQGGRSYPLEFTQIPVEQTRRLITARPQTPQPPFPYQSIELTVPVAGGKFTLSGTLTHPSGSGPFPVVVLISGSGPQDRDETIYDHKPFWVIADYLTRQGIAVFRYDERGVGRSTGVFGEVTTRDLANDVADIVQVLSRHPLIDARRIGLVGHSEGGLIAPMVAAEQPQLAAVVMMAGPGVPGRQIVLNQSREIAKAAGLDSKALEAQEKMLIKLLSADAAREDQFKNAFSQGLEMFRNVMPPEFQEQLDAMREQFSESLPMISQQFQTPWFQYFLDYDPAPALAKLKMPVMVMIGDKDLQVDPDLNLPVIEAQLKKANNSDVTIKRFEHLNHLFQNCQTGEPREYAVIEETFAPVALEFLSAWLKHRLLTP